MSHVLGIFGVGHNCVGFRFYERGELASNFKVGVVNIVSIISSIEVLGAWISTEWES